MTYLSAHMMHSRCLQYRSAFQSSNL